MNSDWPPYETDTSEQEGINISPLIDVIFILLLFFVVTSVFIEESGILVDKPDSKQAGPLEKDPVTISITASQDIYVGTQHVAIKELNRFLNHAKGKPAVIQADGAVRTDFLVKVMDQVKASGVSDIALATDKIQ